MRRLECAATVGMVAFFQWQTWHVIQGKVLPGKRTRGEAGAGIVHHKAFSPDILGSGLNSSRRRG